MLAKTVTELPAGEEWEYEVKWDGYRVEAIKTGKQIRLYSRKGNDLTLKFPQVLKALAKIKARSAVLDGELIAVDTTGNPSFQELQNCAISHRDCKLLYCAFDLLH
ncbi:MAG: putative ligase, partial [Pedosphaera sp.]|nr:putative ligase [Pedosphaera sp.]